MSSDKAPERIVRVTDGFETSYEELSLAVDVPQVLRDAGAVIYIREDLTLDFKLKNETLIYDMKMQGYRAANEKEKAYCEEIKRPMLDQEQLRRRELFIEEAMKTPLNGYIDVGRISEKIRYILEAADKFAKGEQ